ncbi:hypothetical protein VP01_2673g3 [Puccinia sorghi]|uniref:Endopeptidase S2P n=1 Tax=Puccinia sorghi TaxID=27349 RepID=A0A0L6V3W4_9BASI|nr:hypothetical protein VP01_2673g3 [Puccinia sorghi]
MFIWLAASFWLLLSFLTCSKGRKKKYLPTAPRKQTLFDYGVGWLQVETEELNNLPIKFLSLLGVLHQLSNPPSALRDPKSFDDSGDESGPPRARQLRKPSQVSHTKRLLLNTTYDIGAVLCVMGVFVSLVALLSGLLCLLGKIYNWSFSVKENSPASESSIKNQNQIRCCYSWRQIPGLTIPLSTFPVFLLALVLSQIIHEAGHAIAATLNSVSIQSVGFYLLFPLIPVCYVKTLAQSDKNHPKGHDKLTHLRSLRVATAGVWHNLFLAVVSWLAWNGGYNLFDSTVGRAFWRDINNDGAMVAHVAQNSTLRILLNSRDVVVQIDDISLQGGGSLYSPNENSYVSTKRWDSYLSEESHSSRSSKPLKGWCYSNPDFQTHTWFNFDHYQKLALPFDCCQLSNSTAAQGVRFTMCFGNGEPKQDHCLEYQHTAQLASHERCITDAECLEEDTCIKPVPGQEFVFIQVLPFKTGASTTLLYAGSKESLRNERVMNDFTCLLTNFAVTVTSLMPRYDFINADLILIIHEMFRYLVSLSLGLAFVNLLPIANFDGLAICEAVVSFISSVPLDDQLENCHQGIDLNPIGHARPASAFDQYTFQYQNRTRIEIQHSILFKFLNLLIYLSTLLPILVTNNSLSSRYISHTNFGIAQHRQLRILQKVVTWISAFVFFGLLLSSL